MRLRRRKPRRSATRVHLLRPIALHLLSHQEARAWISDDRRTQNDLSRSLWHHKYQTSRKTLNGNLEIPGFIESGGYCEITSGCLKPHLPSERFFRKVVELAREHLGCPFIAFLHLRMHIMICFPKDRIPRRSLFPHFSAHGFFLLLRPPCGERQHDLSILQGRFLTVCGILWHIWNEMLDGWI